MPKALADVVMGALSMSPGDRFATAEAFGVAIGEAATLGWGPGWLASADLPLLVSGSIMASIERDSRDRSPQRPLDLVLRSQDGPAWRHESAPRFPVRPRA